MATQEATAAAVELAQELNVDLAQVEGSGTDGRVTKEDVQAFATSSEEEAASAPEEVYELQLNPKRTSVAVEINGTYYHGGELVPASEAEELTAYKDTQGIQYLVKSKVVV